jgi:pimeloyl-ACP methyl ester carboxylesterase
LGALEGYAVLLAFALQCPDRNGPVILSGAYFSEVEGPAFRFARDFPALIAIGSQFDSPRHAALQWLNGIGAKG